MQSKWSSTKHSERLKRYPRRDTMPEVSLRRAMHKLGLRFYIARQLASRLTADIVFPTARVAIFVDGCFWHGCPIHRRRRFRGANANLWTRKITRNRMRD